MTGSGTCTGLVRGKTFAWLVGFLILEPSENAAKTMRTRRIRKFVTQT